MSKKVSLARIDKRLLHATVTLNWDPFIRVDYVAVVGSEYKNDPFTASVLQLCLPRTMKVKILKEEELMEFLELNEGPKAYRVLVIFKDLETARKCGTGILGRRDPAALSNRRNRRKKEAFFLF